MKLIKQMARLYKLNGGKKLPRMQKAQPPIALERDYTSLIKRTILEETMALIRARLLPKLEQLAAKPNPLQRDADDEDVDDIVDGIYTELQKRWPKRRVVDLIRPLGRQIAGYQAAQLNKQVRVVTNVDVVGHEPWLESAIDQFTKENVAYIRDIPDLMLSQIDKDITRELATGARFTELIDIVEKRFDIAESRAALIARDQTNKFFGSLAQKRQTDLGIDQFIWNTVHDERVRPEHAALDGKVFNWSAPPSEGIPGEAINCFPGTTLIEFSNLAEKAFRYWYRGELAELITDSGESLTSTVNHPILTQRGWVAANSIDEGDYLVKVVGKQPKFFIENVNSTVAKASDIYSALPSSIVETACSTGFHGDAVNKKIEIKDINRNLLTECLADTSKVVSENVFSLAHYSTICKSTFEQCITSSRDAANRVMSLFSESLSFLLRSLPHTGIHSGGAVASLNAPSFKHLGYDKPAVSVDLRKLFLANTLGVLPDDIELHRIAKRNFVPHDGFVFNFQTEKGHYVANGFAVHNCRCFAEPIINIEDDSEN